MKKPPEKQIELRLFATLRKQHSHAARRLIHGESSISDILRQLGIPEKEAAIIFLNGRHADKTEIPEHGDTLSIFPPIGGG